MEMTVDLSQLHVDTDAQKTQWIDLLYIGINFHKAMALEMKSDILVSDESMNADEMFHTALANAIRDCITLVEMMEIEEEEDGQTTERIE
jgi:galactitol-specific phosphotransferase system IIB component